MIWVASILLNTYIKHTNALLGHPYTYTCHAARIVRSGHYSTKHLKRRISATEPIFSRRHRRRAAEMKRDRALDVAKPKVCKIWRWWRGMAAVGRLPPARPPRVEVAFDRRARTQKERERERVHASCPPGEVRARSGLSGMPRLAGSPPQEGSQSSSEGCRRRAESRHGARGMAQGFETLRPQNPPQPPFLMSLR